MLRVRGLRLRAAWAAPVVCLAIAACQPGNPARVPTPAFSPGASSVPSASPWQGNVTATFTKLDGIPATPDPIAATDVTGKDGTVRVIQGRDHGRALEIRIADTNAPTLDQVYQVVAPDALDITGTRPGASLSLTASSGSWVSQSGTVTIDLVAGQQLGCYFKDIAMTPLSGTTGSFQFDGQAQALLGPY